MKKKIKITMDGSDTNITLKNMSLGELAKALADVSADEDLDDCEDDGFDDDDFGDGDDYAETGNPGMRMMDAIMKDKIDIVAAAGYDVVAKIVEFTYEGMPCYGIEVTPAVNGVTKMPEYSLDVNEDGHRTIVQNGNGTLIVPYPIFRKPITEEIELEDCTYTGEVVTCKPGEDAVRGISVLVEMLKTKI